MVSSHKTTYSFWNIFQKPQIGPARKFQDHIFGTYRAVWTNGQLELIHGRPVYRSRQGNAIWYCGDTWYIGLYDERDNCQGFAHSGWRTEKCVEKIRSKSWRVLNPYADIEASDYADEDANDEWLNDKSLMVKCAQN